MVQNQGIQAKGRKAVLAAVGPDRLPDLTDIESIPFVDAIMRECLRWQPVLPLGV
jgi:hypothetical protein